MDCIFCKIINKEIPAAIVYEDEHTIAFLDINPLSPKGGHTLLVPKEHAETLADLSEKNAKYTALALKKLSKAMLKMSEGLNIIQNNKSTAGQFVPHVHFHLIPRFRGDGIKIAESRSHKLTEEEMKTVEKKIKTLLND